MKENKGSEQLTGRILASPSSLLHEEILKPQFDYELEHLLPFYIQIEVAMTQEYKRMGLLDEEVSEEIIGLLNVITPAEIKADPKSNMSDICFAIEQYIENHLQQPAVKWHVDRSRNDVQATAQLMFARRCLAEMIAEFALLVEDTIQLCEENVSVPMPGYTHYQSAQIITIGFYFTAVTETLQKTLGRLLRLYEEINECPLGAGAMAGMELEWDREALAETLGFSRPCPHALVSVASKDWMVKIASECSNAAVSISRFVTDLITWGSSEYQFFTLPDEMSGISSAMPQKKNFPVLERIRGRTAHLTSYYFDIVNSQRNTPFTNLVETAKEGGAHFYHLAVSMKSVLKLFSAVMKGIQFKEDRLYELCTKDFYGGFSVANMLTLRASIPYRQAQVIAGKYIVSMLQQNRKPTEIDVDCFNKQCEAAGFVSPLSEEHLLEAFEVQQSLLKKQTLGSTNPMEVERLLHKQKQYYLEQQRLILNLMEVNNGTQNVLRTF
ncbi:argininosuccinate lyase [Fictibacillus fluitans]|uniref:argininosuccinate lyase n=1 Tax=Fictibacillus fluitans TaxID=3058422 RepID=A0ABT8HTK6_9BACL|nr:lyase family protein [Fictibacillus sp. NE201]MDN4524094.1 lyase family protein [Fictibacillus sp. NE201]